MSQSQQLWISTLHINPRTAWIAPFTLFCQRAAVAVLTLLIVLVLVGARSAQAQTFEVVYTFNGGPDGATPEAGLSQDPRNGNLYGTTDFGAKGYGGVFKLAPSGSGWAFTPLYNFAGGADGAGSRSRIAVSPDGTLYGATIGGGIGDCSGYRCGTIFSLKPPVTIACKTLVCFWKKTLLHAFDGVEEGAFPYGDLTLDDSGNIFGGTFRGGAAAGPGGHGVIFKLTKGSWSESVLYTFQGSNDGGDPQGGVIFGPDRNLYGTALEGGVDSAGLAFQLSPGEPEWTENILHSFQSKSDGGAPIAGVVFDRSGNLYGATIQDGPATGGTVFMLDSGSWNFHVLYSFSQPGGQNCGPQESLFLDQASGNLYGTTLCDGENHMGSVFKLTPDGQGGYTETNLHIFTGRGDGAYPFSNVVFDSQGNLYGTASTGGNLNCNAPNGCGVVWKITP